MTRRAVCALPMRCQRRRRSCNTLSIRVLRKPAFGFDSRRLQNQGHLRMTQVALFILACSFAGRSIAVIWKSQLSYRANVGLKSPSA
jgi:hypothetical protein